MEQKDTTPLTFTSYEQRMRTLRFGWDIENNIFHSKGTENLYEQDRRIVVNPDCCSFRFFKCNKIRDIFDDYISIEKEMFDNEGNIIDMRGHFEKKHNAQMTQIKQYLVDSKGEERYSHENSGSFNFSRRSNEVLFSGATMKYRFEFTLVSNSPTEYREELEILVKLENLVVNMGQLLETEHLSDLTIITADEDKPIRAHKNILASRSPVFKAMFDSGLGESKTNVLKREDIDPETMKVFLRYIYTDELKFEESTSVNLITTIFKLADQYQLPRLKHLCEAELVPNYDADSISEILLLAYTYNAKYMKRCGLEYIQSNKSVPALHRTILSMIRESEELGPEILAALVN